MARIRKKRQVMRSQQKIVHPEERLRPRLHYGWLQLERDKAAAKRGVRQRQRSVNRVMRLRGSYAALPIGRTLRRHALFKLREHIYKTIDYNTFTKNGLLKLTEIELYFLSSYMTKATASEWGLVYLGIGDGNRFRSFRDDYFPDLAVVAFDPLDPFFDSCRAEVEETADRWTNDGSNFTFLIRAFDPDTDSEWITKKFNGRRLLFISDIRGINLTNGGTAFDKHKDQDEQWKAIQALRPEKSLCKFTTPSANAQWYTYAPGVLLKQTFCYYSSAEVRILIDGVPQERAHYNVWEISDKLMYHHTHARGQVYKSSIYRDAIGCRCVDSCFDCTVLWNTVSKYAKMNALDPYVILKKILADHGYGAAAPEADSTTILDMERCLDSGLVMEAVAILDGGKDDVKDAALPYAIKRLWSQQPDLAQMLANLDGGNVSRGSLINALRSLSVPFTLVKSELNGLLDWPDWSWNPLWQKWFDRKKQDTQPNEKSCFRACWHFANGRCRYGDQCTWMHDRSAAQSDETANMPCALSS